jgi:hypothetical protein
MISDLAFPAVRQRQSLAEIRDRRSEIKKVGT